MKIHIILIAILFLLYNRSYAQQKKELHFLADTLNIDQNNRILEIGSEANMQYYMFFCKCVPPYGKGYNLSFKVDKKKIGKLEDHVAKYKFISWKELADLTAIHQDDFNKKYRFFITELLPDRHYRTSEVEMVIYKEGVADAIKLPD